VATDRKHKLCIRKSRERTPDRNKIMNKVAQKGMEKSSTCHEGSDFIEDVAEES
jgi:hypothetical protein